MSYQDELERYQDKFEIDNVHKRRIDYIERIGKSVRLLGLGSEFTYLNLVKPGLMDIFDNDFKSSLTILISYENQDSLILFLNKSVKEKIKLMKIKSEKEVFYRNENKRRQLLREEL